MKILIPDYKKDKGWGVMVWLRGLSIKDLGGRALVAGKRIYFSLVPGPSEESTAGRGIGFRLASMREFILYSERGQNLALTTPFRLPSNLQSTPVHLGYL